MKAMIAESRKAHNQEFGRHIIRASQEVAKKRNKEQQHSFKDFLMDNSENVRYWRETKDVESRQRRA